jgi:hypothetical protein
LFAGLLVFGPGADVAAADIVGTGYVDADLVDLQWATDHLDFDSVGEFQRAGVTVVDFILSISRRSDSEGAGGGCDLGYADQLDPLGPNRFVTSWSGVELATLDRVAAHYCISREQAQTFGATVLTFLAGLDAGVNGTTAVRRVVDAIAPPRPIISVQLTGSGPGTVMLDEPPPVDHRVVVYEHAGTGVFRVVGLDVSGREVEVLVERDGVVGGRVLIEGPAMVASVEVVADGEWSVAFESVVASPSLDLSSPVLRSGDAVFLVPAALGGEIPRYRHIGDGSIRIASRGPAMTTSDVLVAEAGSVVSRFRLPTGGRVLAVEATGEWALVDGDDLPPGRPGNPIVTAGDGSVRLDWEPAAGGGLAIDRYELAHRVVPMDGPTTEWTMVEVPSVARMGVAEGLANGVAHQVRVRAVNGIGAGLWTEPLSAAPMAPVVAVEVVGLVANPGDTTVSLAWEEPVGVEAVSYTVVYFDEAYLGGESEVEDGSRTTTSRRSIIDGWSGGESPSDLAERHVYRGPSGFRAPMIVDGNPVAIIDNPHVLGLLDGTVADPFNAHYCGATLIAPRWAVTAAHCVEDRAISDVDVVAGIADLRDITDADRIEVSAIHIHPEYEAVRVLHDIALLELASDAPGTPIPWQVDPVLPVAGTSLMVSGWGAISADGSIYDTVLRLSPAVALGGPGDSVCGSWRDYEPDSELCVGAASGVGACSGDSGGPVVAELGMTRLVGITSYGLSGSCADTTYPNVAARVSSKAAWITSMVGSPWRETSGLQTPSHEVDGLVNGRMYTFHVTAIDAMGRSLDQMQVTAMPVGPPTAPNGLTGRGGDSRAVLAWEGAFAAVDAPVTGHVVEWSLDGARWEREHFAVGVTRDFAVEVTGLVNETTVHVRVRAVNRHGTGPASDPVTVVVGQPDAPTGLVGQVGDGRLDLSWSAPVDDGGSPILDYVLETASDGGLWATVDDGTSAIPSAVLDGLANGRPVRVRVSAMTAVGRGPVGMVVRFVPGRPAVPTEVTAEPGDSIATVRWVAPVADGGSPVTGYRIEYSTDGGALWDLVGVSDSGTEALVEPLENGTTYWLRVRAITAIGVSQAALVTVTPATVPGIATDLVVVGGVGELSFSWVRPSDGGSPATQVLVEVVEDGLVDWTVFTAGPRTTSARIGGLSGGLHYRVRVRYVNTMGSSAPSEELLVLVE